ncbi:iron-sulfur cluster assembly 2 homolog, mitochondrial-like [Acanthaster planci]|uniref:Iron-sulfur cluster assembly 2 homolog, mitochondrial n=1 Tax=Acanthaster planci TaxID=133434 RepID=A0A8B7YBF4_ACAPL|nr:iron-sulfur cluster assembly 2 homolog, mitochondrial-like [Acanthaster planci]
MAAYMMKRCWSLGRALRGQLHHQVCQKGSYPKHFSVSTEAVATEDSINITDSCVKQLSRINDGDKHLRVLVEGGGCSGFQCKFQLDSQENVTGEDRVFERDGVKVIVDEVSLGYIKGATVDYHEELIRSAFRVINIPMAENGCSCGVSFSLKL